VSAEATVSRGGGPLLGSPNRFKLAVFGPNCQRGTLATHAPGALQLSWPASRAIAEAADAAGFEALVSLARWKSAARGAPADDRMFETLTWTAAAAAVTERIQVLATVHVPLVAPLLVAKAGTTIDHVSGGRFGLNVVAGFKDAEFAMFGLDQLPHDERYDAADAWMRLLVDAWTRDEPFDVDGAYVHGRGIVSEPKPLQAPRPLVMAAGASTAGQRFARTHADLSFVMLPDIDAAAPMIAAAKASARDAGREILVFAGAWIVCAQTEAEARALYEEAVGGLADRAAAEAMVDEIAANSRSADALARDALVRRAAGGFGLPLVGTPAQVVTQMGRLADAGLDGLAVYWVDYAAGIAQYREQLLPRLIADGLRQR